jgi:ribonucleoside-diphosphate reductase alpha chain
MNGPQTEAAERLHALKYRQPGEDFREAMNRIAFGLRDNDEHYHAFRKILLDMRFMPGGRIQNAIGASRATTPFNCFVSGTIEDSLVTGAGCIMDRQKEAVATLRMGGGIGYDFSTLRPKGDKICHLGSVTDGPIAFMHGFDAYCGVISSAGHRRGAQMGIMRVDHPDIVEFVHAKQNGRDLTRFNISVAVTGEFMRAVEQGGNFDLRFRSEIHQTVDARELWEKIMRSTYDWGEPGVVFIDTMNDMNNLYYCETIAATNPCGEQPLPPFGACLLGSYNLVKYLVPQTGPTEQRRWSFDFDALKADIFPVVRAMDNVVDQARYPLAEQKAEAVNKRRMGLGVTGLANAAEACGYPYASQEFIDFERKVLRLLRDEAYRSSVLLAAEKGPFTLFDSERYLAGRFVSTLPKDIREAIAVHGIRNSHLTSIAPTGTISMCADNVSGGIEPVFSYRVERDIGTPDGAVRERIEDYGAKFLGVRGRLADDVSAEEHVAVLVAAQEFVDSAVSKTVNMDGQKMTWEAFKQIYTSAYLGGAKGCATFNKSGKRMALLLDAEAPPPQSADLSCQIDPVTGHKECA